MPLIPKIVANLSSSFFNKDTTQMAISTKIAMTKKIKPKSMPIWNEDFSLPKIKANKE